MPTKKNGPVPKRSSERRRRNKDSKPQTVELKGIGPVPVPPSDPNWHELAREWYEALASSGQSKFYEPSDWAAARLLAAVMSKNLKQTKFSSVLFATVWAGMGDLLTTEGERRRVRMEIEREQSNDEPASVTAIADYRKRLVAGGKNS